MTRNSAAMRQVNRMHDAAARIVKARGIKVSPATESLIIHEMVAEQRRVLDSLRFDRRG